jgi:3-hydroxyacyl-CoA dehydrogenase
VSAVDEQTRDSVVLERRGAVAVITADNPPINALSHHIRAGLLRTIREAADDDSVSVIVLACAGRTFFAGADISEFGAPLEPPLLDQINTALEDAGKPSVAAIHGTALGGGLELALSCHYRVCIRSARLGLPEVTLGIIPGAGGTQRLPRLVGVEKAIQLITTGLQVGAAEAQSLGLADAVVEGDLLAEAIEFAEAAASREPPPPVRLRDEKLASARGNSGLFAAAREAAAKAAPGQVAPAAVVDAIEAAVTRPFDEGLARERELVLELLGSPQARALQYFFFAERAAAKVPGLAPDTPTVEIGSAAVIGAGTMGSGIATALANAGIGVVLVEQGQEQLDRGVAAIRSNWERQVKRGRMTEEEAERRAGLIRPTLDFADVSDVDLVIEAVFEQMALKKETFAKLDGVVRPGAVLGTNTSTLDVNEIASVTGRPQDVIGLHFFSPAHVMKLLEVVRGDVTSDAVIATAMALGRRLRKVPVLVGVCDGFVGNRMLLVREREATRLLLEGASPRQVDRVLKEFGFPMGSYEMADMAGAIDILYRRRQETGEREPISDRLFERGRYGVKSGAGYYRYEPGSREALDDPVVDEVILEAAATEGVERREIADEEVLERLLYPMINEGMKILDEGVASRASDVDVIWVYGYGWPAYRGGPLHYADEVGLGVIRNRLRELAADHGPAFEPAPLLERLADEGARVTEPFGSRLERGLLRPEADQAGASMRARRPRGPRRPRA